MPASSRTVRKNAGVLVRYLLLPLILLVSSCERKSDKDTARPTTTIQGDPPSSPGESLNLICSHRITDQDESEVRFAAFLGGSGIVCGDSWGRISLLSDADCKKIKDLAVANELLARDTSKMRRVNNLGLFAVLRWDPPSLEIWDFTKNTVEATVPVEIPLKQLYIAAGGCAGVTLGGFGRVEVLDFCSRNPRPSPPEVYQLSMPQFAALVSKDRKVVFVEFDGTIRVIDGKTRKPSSSLAIADAFVTSVAVSSTEEYVAFGTSEGEFITLTLSSGKAYRLQIEPKAQVTAMAFRDRHRLIAGLSDGRIVQWNIKSKQQTASVQAHEGKVLSLDINPDGKRLVTGGADGVTGSLKIWEFREKPE